jgi:Flp pilus assembly protein TadD
MNLATTIRKSIFFFLAVLVLQSCSGQYGFEDRNHTLIDEEASKTELSSANVQEEIDAFAEKVAKNKSKHRSSTFVAQGLLNLSKNELFKANRNFQHALKFDPQNAHLHMLNALSHQLRGESGDPEQYKMAEVGYGLAARLDPGNSQIPYFLGVLQFKQQKFRKAQEYFSSAVMLNEVHPEYFTGLAAASYYLGELGRAYANIEKALQLDPSQPASLQAGGIIYATLGAFDKAKFSSSLLGKKSKIRQSYLEQRITDWQRYYAKNDILADIQIQNQLAQTLDVFGVPSKGMFDPTGDNNDAPSSQDPDGGSGSNFDASKTPPPPGTLLAPSASPAINLITPNKTIRSVRPTYKALPPPAPKLAAENSVKTLVSAPIKKKKKIKIPSMALVDVAIIRTEEIYSTSKGVNLLNGLNIFFTGDQFLQAKSPFGLGRLRGPLPNNDTVTLKLGTAGAGLTYSLNIFSDNYDRNEVIARPTILVEDQKKSSFFSGSTMHVVMEGGVAGGGSIQPINTGVKLEVTPKFLDKETIDLEVFAQRIFLEAGLSQVSDTITGTSFASTSKTTLSANLTLRYGETMVLSGLSDQEKETLDDKVPGVGDIPGVQYLFRNQRKTSVKKTVLILLTPRRAGLSYEDGEPKDTNDYSSRKAINRLEKSVDWMRPTSNLKAFVKHLGKYEFFNHYRKGDMQLEDWAGEGTVDDAITRTLEYFYIYYGFEKSDESSL